MNATEELICHLKHAQERFRRSVDNVDKVHENILAKLDTLEEMIGSFIRRGENSAHGEAV